MKLKHVLLAAGFLMSASLFAQSQASANNCAQNQPSAANVQGGASANGCNDQCIGDCWCRYVHWQPCYYQTSRCVDEKIPCEKTCWRMVPKYTEQKRVRYVPQEYTVRVCHYERESYCVPDCKTVQRTVYDQHCRWVPQYYWKHECNANTNVQAPQCY